VNELRELAPSADCRRRRVAALVVRDGVVVGRGVNGLPDERSCLAGECPRGLLSYDEVPASSSYAGNCDATHAERAALAEAGELARGAELHVTATPCQWCEEAAWEAGIDTIAVHLDSTERGPSPSP
jgi:dCMP deaminase